MTTVNQDNPVRRYNGDGTWSGTEVRPYKNDGNIFKDVTRQNLFDSPHLGCQWRYFEVEPDGHTTLERHKHVHAVMVLRGKGRVLVENKTCIIEINDLITIPSLCWHQFRAGPDSLLGFLCLVNQDRDRPQLPDDEDLAILKQNKEVADFIRI